MTTSFHKDQHTVAVFDGLSSEKEVHAPFSFEYANATTRLAATGFIANHVGKIAHQLDDHSFWVLTSYSPITWHRLDSSAAAVGLKSGKLIPSNFSGNPKRATVTFSTAFADAGYVPIPVAISDGSRSFSPSPEVKTSSGFVVNLNANNLAGLIEVGWHAIVTGD